MNGLMYSASFNDVAVTAAQDLFSLLVTAPDVAILHSIRIGQENLEGDANAEMLDLQIARAGTVGSGGTAPTGIPHMVGAPAASVTVRANDTTEAVTAVPIVIDTFNLQAGWLYLPTPEERILLSSAAASDLLAVSLLSAPAGSTTMSGTITWEELLG